MSYKKFEGIFPALVTPFDENGKVKEEGLRQVVRYLIDVQKVDGLYLTGSTGEFLLLEPNDKKRILEIVADEAKNAVTLIAQIGSLNLTEVKELAQLAEKLKYDAISAITPYYYGFSFEEVKLYYQEISTASSLPMFIYYLPQLAGGKVTLDQFGELLNIKNVVGSKYGSTDLFFFERLKAKYPDKTFLFAWDEAFALGLTLGAKGFIGSTYNVNTKGVRTIMDAFIAGDKEKVQELTHKYNDYISDLLSKGLMQTIKAVMSLEGVDAGYSKKPFRRPEDQELKLYAKQLKQKYNL